MMRKSRKKSSNDWLGNLRLQNLENWNISLELKWHIPTRGFLYLKKYVADLLKEIGNIGCKTIGNPRDANKKLEDAKKEPKVDR